MEDSEFRYRKEPKSTSEQAALYPAGRAVGIAKGLLQRYLQRWLTPDSYHQRLLRLHAPNAAKFVLDSPEGKRITINSEFSWSREDPGERKVQVARMMKRVRKSYPAILIVDGGFRNRVAGLGDLQGGRSNSLSSGDSVLSYDIVSSFVINVDLMVGAADEDTCSELTLLLSQVLGSPLRRFGMGNLLVSSDPDGSSYQMTLPLENEFGSLSREQLEDDPVDTAWSSSCSLQLEFESVTTLQATDPLKSSSSSSLFVGGGSGTYVPDVAVSGSGLLTISGSKVIRVGNIYEYQIFGPNGKVSFVASTWKLVVSDSRMALINAIGNNRWWLTPQRRGEFTIRLLDGDRVPQAELTILAT